MDYSGYDSHSEIILYRASGYKVTLDGLRNAEYLDMSIPYSAGSLYSTTRDMLRWQEGLFEGKILSSISLNKMSRPFLNNYGLGVIVQSVDGHPSIMHAGGTSGFNTFMLYSPDDKLIVIVLGNLNALGYVAQDLALKMVALAHGKAVILPHERKEVAVSSATLAQYVGAYIVEPHIGAYGSMPMKPIIISLEDGYLMVQMENQPKMQLFPESETLFFEKIPDAQIEFFNNEQGNVSRLVWHQDGESLTGIKNPLA